MSNIFKKPSLSRRQFFGASGMGALVSAMTAGWGGTLRGQDQTSVSAEKDPKLIVPWEDVSANPCVTFGMSNHQAKIYLAGVSEPMRIMLIADTHLYRDDERGVPYQKYSQRMAAAYNVTRHWKTGAETSPEPMFEETLRIAKERQVDCLILLGDMISYPTEAGRDWLLEKLDASGIPFYYTSGNHDWCYEGLPGTSNEWRLEWTEKRLLPLYQGFNPLCYSVKHKCVRFLMIDDSISSILPEQLDFLRKELAYGDPTFVFMHIPPYVPGRSSGFGIGNPNWKGWNNPPEMTEEVLTYLEPSNAFYRELICSKNLIASFTGHVHSQNFDLVYGKPLSTVATNTEGAYMEVQILPASEAGGLS